MSYTPAQQSSIDNYHQHKLMCAGPGSGKTHTVIGLVEKIISAEPDASVLLVTFTNAAAKEMRVRLEKRLGRQRVERQCLISTFASSMIKHSKLPSDALKKGVLRGRKICIGNQAKIFMHNAFRELGIVDFKDKLNAESLINDASKLLDRSELSADIIELMDAYDRALASANAIDLDGLVRELITALINNEISCHRFSHIIVDEFQDTDSLQYEWLRLHGNNGSIVTAVGDDDQSIYSWRQSSGYENMAELMMDFDIRPTILDACFRCPPEVLKASNTLIENNKERVPKQMQSQLPPGGNVGFMPVTDDCVQTSISQLRDVLEQSGQSPDQFLDSIEGQLMQSKRADLSLLRSIALVLDAPHEWAILARSNMMLDDFERYFSVLNIPTLRLGGKSIWDNEILNAFVMGIGVVFMKKNTSVLGSMLAWMSEDSNVIAGILGQSRNVSFTECTTLGDSNAWKPGTVALHELCMKVSHKSISEQDAIRTLKGIIEDAGMQNRGIKGGKQRDNFLNTVQTFFDMINDIYGSIKGTPSQRAQKLIEKSQKGNKDASLESRRNEVVLTTMNSSKGLEFKRVLVHKVESTVTPSKISYTTDCEGPQMPLDDSGLPAVDEDEFYHRVSEERRLLYVAMTRAEHELLLVYRAEHGSGFLREIFGEQDFEIPPPLTLGDLEPELSA